MAPALALLAAVALGGLACAGAGPRPPARRHAYVAIHYEGTPADAAYVLGIRVLLQSLKPLRHPFVVLCSPTVSAATRHLLAAEGATIRQVADLANPFGPVKARFGLALNKLHAFGLEEYDRVVYLDADNIVLDLALLDSLFRCGHFCAVFMNPCHFHTGLLVIRPNASLFADMVARLAATGSYDGADQGFLSAYFRDCGNEAPVFDPEQPSVSKDGMNRLHIAYNMHALYRLPRGNLDLYACTPFSRKSPAASLAYPVAPALKPWHWYSFLFGFAGEWDAVRAGLDEPLVAEACLRLAWVVPLGVLCVALGLRASAPVAAPGPAWRRSWWRCRTLLALGVAVAAGSLVVPPLTRPHIGVAVYATAHILAFGAVLVHTEPDTARRRPLLLAAVGWPLLGFSVLWHRDRLAGPLLGPSGVARLLTTVVALALLLACHALPLQPAAARSRGRPERTSSDPGG